MNWPREYLSAIQRGDEVVGVKIRSVYEREVSWMDAPPPELPFYFDEAAGQRPIDFIETYCKHYEGRWGGKPIQLELFQKAKLQLVFGWIETETGKRRFREVVDLRGRKCGKSTETAGVEQYMLIADGEQGAKIYCVANKLEQAKIIFEAAVNMRAQSEALRAVTKKRQHDIYFPATFSFIKALASDTKTMDGLNAHFFSQDEFHEARDSKLYDVMVQSQAAREQPLAWLISTNGFVREGFFDSKYDYCSKVATWENGFEDYRLLPLLYELDSRDEWTDPAKWCKSNPGLGSVKSYAFLAENVAKAKRDPSFLPTLLVKDFNIPENTNAAWLTYDAAVNETVPCQCAGGHWTLCAESMARDASCKQCGKPANKQSMERFLSHSYGIGFTDLSSTTDLTTCGILVRRPNDENIYVIEKSFLPQSRIDAVEESGAREAPYRLWAEQGWIHVCEGAAVDYRDVTSWFLEMVNVYDIRPLWTCYDMALSGYWAPSMIEQGFDLEKIRQGAFTWSYSMKQMGAALKEHKVVYGNNPVIRWALLNVAKKSTNSDGIETIQPVKTSRSKRIDPMVALLNGWVGYNNHFEEYMRYLR